MTQYLILFRSLSRAQKASRLLERGGLTAVVVKAPQSLTRGGCGYGVSLRRGLQDALAKLERAGIERGRIYQRELGGEYREVEL